jgi:alkylation response protein AidB-like acyl-CoA dehydrogenase
VPRDAPGLEVRAYRLADGSIAGEIKLTRAPASVKLSLDAEGLAAVASELRLYAAAEMVGLGQRLLDDTLAYVKEREQFGVAIGSFQALQHRLVDCYAREEQARSMLYRAALTDRADAAKWQRAAAGAKAFIGENVDAIAREAVQMHGGMGITDELAIGHAMKRVLVLARLFGDVDTVLAEYALAA